MNYLKDPEIAFPLLLTIISRTISTNQNTDSPYFRRHILSFSRLHLGMLYHINSIRFGKVVLKYQQFIQSNAPNLASIFSLDAARQICAEFFLPSPAQICPHVHGMNVAGLGVWYGQDSLRNCRRLEEGGHVKVHAWNSAFTDEFPPNHDWRVPYPDPTFESHKEILHHVESGHGIWVPKIHNEVLVDAGYFTPFGL